MLDASGVINCISADPGRSLFWQEASRRMPNKPVPILLNILVITLIFKLLTINYRLVALILMIESLYVVHLVRCYREVLVLASGKEGILVVKGICLAIVLISLL